MMINQDGIDLIKKFEGCKLQVYLDAVGLPTVGYGCRTDLPVGQKITQKNAEFLLQYKCKYFSQKIADYVKVDLTSNQFSALVSLMYNIGEAPIEKSTLIKLVNEGKFDEASYEFLKWDHAGGKELEGLKLRRQAEQALFLLS